MKQPSVAGIDGCRGGWLVVHHPRDAPQDAHASVCATFADAIACLPADTVIAVDMPIGLPDRIIGSGRSCDRAVRAILGARKASVFTLPSRDAVFAATYLDACDIALTTSDPPRKISKQAFNLFAKVREVDAEMTPERQRRIVECHPEAAFWALNDCVPLDAPKKRGGRLNAEGITMRQRLLADAGYPAELISVCTLARKIAGLDDILDATANAAAAARIARGQGIRFPNCDVESDRRGLKLEIWV